MDINKKINKFPEVSGVYIMKSAKGEVLYIGKASSLKKRLRTHFSRAKDKNIDFTAKVSDVEYIECVSPEQALILEAALIKERRPKYNVALRDNKTYPYVAVSKEKFGRVFITRPKKTSNLILFGPYPGAKTLKSALESIRKVFPFRSCPRMPKKACLFFHLKLCLGPCQGRISSVDYRQIIDGTVKILKGERQKLIKSLERKMKRLSKEKNFEQAAKTRNLLMAVDRLYKGRPKEHQIVSLKKALGLSKLPLHIEAIDISSLGLNQSTGSVVVFKDGAPDKNNYRRFLIRKASLRDDYAMIAEVVKRRYLRLIRENMPLPDLVIIDGGKGHVLRAKAVLLDLGINFSIIGIAKRNEEVWFPDKSKPLLIARNSCALHLLQRIRDEAHRFAHSYQLIRRRKKTFNND